MGIRREEVICHPFSQDFSSDGSSSPEREFVNGSNDLISFANMCSSDSGNCMVHEVSKMDTLAGLAIKYGVEIADIKRTNNLASDLQMFAHKSLLIPISRCHSQLPLHSNCSSTNSINREKPPKAFTKKPNSASSYSPKSKSTPPKTSSAMSTLQRYYSLSPQKPDPLREQATEMAFFNKITNTTNSYKISDSSCDSTPPKLGKSGWFSMGNAISEGHPLTHPLLTNGFNFVRSSASASGLRLRF